VLAKILFDRFEYEPSGILDRTHLRFFTRHTIVQLFETTGYRPSIVGCNRSRSWKFTLLTSLRSDWPGRFRSCSMWSAPGHLHERDRSCI
jgi:hypothetical protein